MNEGECDNTQAEDAFFFPLAERNIPLFVNEGEAVVNHKQHAEKCVGFYFWNCILGAVPSVLIPPVFLFRDVNLKTLISLYNDALKKVAVLV